jgi:heme-degrading monooxygenase HmoA
MYATTRIYSEAEGLADAVAEHRTEILGLFEEIAGFRGYYMVRTGPNSATSVTVYDDQAGAEASNQVARDWVAANLGGVSISPPQVLAGEVAMSA